MVITRGGVKCPASPFRRGVQPQLDPEVCGVYVSSKTVLPCRGFTLCRFGTPRQVSPCMASSFDQEQELPIAIVGGLKARTPLPGTDHRHQSSLSNHPLLKDVTLWFDAGAHQDTSSYLESPTTPCISSWTSKSYMVRRA